MDEELLKKYTSLLQSLNYIQEKINSTIECATSLKEELNNGVIIDNITYQYSDIESIEKEIKSIKNSINSQVIRKIRKKTKKV